VRIVTPAPAGSRRGNRVSAERWAKVLRSLGHRVQVEERLSPGPFDLLVALHAQKSADAVLRSRRDAPDRPVVLVLTGTDVYPAVRSAAARRAIAAADLLVALNPLAKRRVPPRERSKVRVAVQSAASPRGRRPRPLDGFPVCVLAHLRAIKDPFRAALAVRRLPPASRVRVLHAGAALEPAAARRAQAESARNPRWTWLGDLPRGRALRLLSRCRLLVLSSKSEGGSQAIGEAVAAGVPVIASRIEGSVGLLGASYPGWFLVGDAAGLAQLLGRAERDPQFLASLRAACARVAPRFRPARERAAWRSIVAEAARLHRG
jgi:putative glycosyltransferase (TIGR04348 family)